MREKRNPDERKQEIIQVAGELFAANGYKKTQVKDIVQTIGVAQGLFYYYFKSKEEVMEAIAEQYADGVIEKINQSITDDKTTYEKMEIVFNTFITTAQEKNSLFIEIQSADNGSVQASVHKSVGKKLVPIVVSIIEEGNKKHECDCRNPYFTVEFCVRGIFSILSDLSPEEKIEYLTANFSHFREVIKRIFKLELED